MKEHFFGATLWPNIRRHWGGFMSLSHHLITIRTYEKISRSPDLAMRQVQKIRNLIYQDTLTFIFCSFFFSIIICAFGLKWDNSNIEYFFALLGMRDVETFRTTLYQSGDFFFLIVHIHSFGIIRNHMGLFSTSITWLAVSTFLKRKGKHCLYPSIGCTAPGVQRLKHKLWFTKVSSDCSNQGSW